MRILIVAALLSACIRSSTGPQLGDNVELRYGASVMLPGDTVNVQFTDVTADSRCPTGAQCVWAGEATMLLTVGYNQQVSLTLGADATRAMAIARGARITLVALKPYPTLNGSPVKADYVATLRFDSAKD